MTTTKEDMALGIIGKSIPSLAYYYRASEEASFMEGILNEIFKARFTELNKEDEIPRYATKSDECSIGSVWIGRSNNPDHYCMDISFCPSPCIQERLSYVQRPYGVINLSEKTYGLGHSRGEPEELFIHTAQILESWGLTKVQFRRSKQH
jgi:hypothetical protein